MKNIARIHNRERGRAVETLLNAANYLREHRAWPNDRDAIKILLECAVKIVANPIYMAHGLRIDRNEDGHIALFGESRFFATADGKLIRAHS